MKMWQSTFVYVTVGLMVVTCVSMAEAQGRRGGGRMGGMGGMGGSMGGFGMGGSLSLLERADVRKELELLDDQIEELKGLRSGMDMRSMFAGVRDLPREEQRAKMTELMTAARKKIEDKVNGVLLPHQATRLKQLAVQFALQRPGGVTSGTVAKELGISDQQREQLRAKAQKLQAELQKKLQAELVKELTPAQQAKLKELVGKPFTFEQISPPQFGGGRGRTGRSGGSRRGN